jgi:hypothetical protein
MNKTTVSPSPFCVRCDIGIADHELCIQCEDCLQCFCAVDEPCQDYYFKITDLRVSTHTHPGRVKRDGRILIINQDDCDYCNDRVNNPTELRDWLSRKAGFETVEIAMREHRAHLRRKRARGDDDDVSDSSSSSEEEESDGGSECSDHDEDVSDNNNTKNQSTSERLDGSTASKKARTETDGMDTASASVAVVVATTTSACHDTTTSVVHEPREDRSAVASASASGKVAV